MLDCKIISPTKAKFFKELKSITLPAWHEQAQILPSHAEAFILLKKGQIALELADGSKRFVEIQKGGFYIKDDQAVVIL